MVNVYEIRTERLLMRRWRRSDREPLAALNADPEVMRHFPAPLDRVQSDTAVDRYEELFENNGFGLWALERAADGTFLGFTGLNAMPEGVPGEGDQEVGWRLAQHAWHQGYATEAARAAVEAAFGPLAAAPGLVDDRRDEHPVAGRHAAARDARARDLRPSPHRARACPEAARRLPVGRDAAGALRSARLSRVRVLEGGYAVDVPGAMVEWS